jgi:hypothetical protein
LAEMSITYCQLAKSTIVGRASEGDSANWQKVTDFLPIVRTALAERGIGRVTSIHLTREENYFSRKISIVKAIYFFLYL